MSSGELVWRSERVADLSVQTVGLVAATIAVCLLVAFTLGWADRLAVVAVLAYGASLVATFAMSLLNALHRQSRHGSLVRLLDHSVIYLLIAGTYTPFCLLPVNGRRDLGLLALVWLGAAAGVAFRVLLRRRIREAAITVYVLLGWCGVIHWDSFAQRATSAGLALIAIGGVLYTLGAPLHRWRSLRYHDALWHGCVVAAAACHFGAVVLALSSVHLPASGF